MGASQVALPAWILGHDPSAKIISVSYTSGLAGEFCRKCRRMVKKLSPTPEAMFSGPFFAYEQEISTG